MNALSAWIIEILLTILIAVVIISLVRKPMAHMLSSNSIMKQAATYYLRTFILVIILGALAAIAGSGPPASDKIASMTCMEWVWWFADQLESVLWSLSLFLMGYVLLLTILFAVLGRHHD